MLKNIQKYDILHLIIDDCRQKILKKNISSEAVIGRKYAK